MRLLLLISIVNELNNGKIHDKAKLLKNCLVEDTNILMHQKFSNYSFFSISIYLHELRGLFN